MIVAIYTFGISFAALALMLLMKYIEVRTGRKTLMAKSSDAVNHIVRDYYQTARTTVEQVTTQNIGKYAEAGLIRVVAAVYAVYEAAKRRARAYPRTRKIMDMVQGRGELRKKGAASLYLKRISEEAKSFDKEDAEKGKIE